MTITDTQTKATPERMPPFKLLKIKHVTSNSLIICMISKVYNVDCMEYMRNIPDKYFSIAIADPPYGIGSRLSYKHDNDFRNTMSKFYDQYKKKQWDIVPDNDFFTELFRVSKNAIIFGFNYYSLPPSRGVIVWDKQVFIPSMSRCELIWTSFDCPATIITIRSANKEKFHITQKPVNLYEFLFNKFCKEGDTIFDPMMGSQSSRIAANRLGFDYVGCEIDKEYFELGCRFFNEQSAQKNILFT